MKKKLFVLSIAVLALSYSCKENKKEKAEDEATMGTAMFSLVKDSTKVSFTAYKTTEKKPVGGLFKDITITNSHPASTPLAAINGIEFSIPVSSLFTNDPTGTRDPKIIEFFFGALKNTALISGVFHVEGDACALEVTLNGETATIPLQAEMTAENSYTFTGVMDLKKWDATAAVASINKACELLHTGPDGISKTWDEVALKGQVLFEKK